MRIHGLGGGDGGLQGGEVEDGLELQRGNRIFKGSRRTVDLGLGFGVPGVPGSPECRRHGGHGGSGVQAGVHRLGGGNGGLQSGEIQDGLQLQRGKRVFKGDCRRIDLGLGLCLPRKPGYGEGGRHGRDAGGGVQARIHRPGGGDGGLQGGLVQGRGGVAAVNVQGDPGADPVVHEGEGVVRIAMRQRPGNVEARGVALDAAGIVGAVGALGVDVHGKGGILALVGLEGPGVIPVFLGPGRVQREAGVLKGRVAAAQIPSLAVGEVVLPHPVVGGSSGAGGPEHGAVHVADDDAVADLHSLGAAGGAEAGIGLFAGNRLVGHGVPALRHDHVGLARLDPVGQNEGGVQGNRPLLEGGDRAVEGGGGAVDLAL